MYTKNFLRIIKLVLLLFNISYFVGMFWLVFCELSMDWTESNLKASVLYMLTNKINKAENCKKLYGIDLEIDKIASTSFQITLLYIFTSFTLDPTKEACEKANEDF